MLLGPWIYDFDTTVMMVWHCLESRVLIRRLNWRHLHPQLLRSQRISWSAIGIGNLKAINVIIFGRPQPEGGTCFNFYLFLYAFVVGYHALISLSFLFHLGFRLHYCILIMIWDYCEVITILKESIDKQLSIDILNKVVRHRHLALQPHSLRLLPFHYNHWHCQVIRLLLFWLKIIIWSMLPQLFRWHFYFSQNNILKLKSNTTLDPKLLLWIGVLLLPSCHFSHEFRSNLKGLLSPFQFDYLLLSLILTPAIRMLLVLRPYLNLLLHVVNLND